MEPKVKGIIQGRSTYAGRCNVYDIEGIMITVMANWGVKSPPPDIY